MRRLLPLALLLVACAKPTEAPQDAKSSTVPPLATASTADLTPEGIAKAADVPLYPGAEAPQNMSEVPQHRSDGSTHYSLVLATADPVAKVTSWYTGKLKLESKPMKDGETIIGKTSKGNDLMMTVQPEAGRTLVRIKSIHYAP